MLCLARNAGECMFSSCLVQCFGLSAGGGGCTSNCPSPKLRTCVAMLIVLDRCKLIARELYGGRGNFR